MKRVLAIIALVVAVPLLSLGLLFLIAAGAGKPERILTGAAFIIVALLPLAWGILTLRRLIDTSPEALAAGTIALARRLGGEVTVAQVQAEFRIPAGQAFETLEKLVAAGQAERQAREAGTAYVIRGLQAATVTRSCPYCGSNFPVREALSQCPNCGASLELSKR